MNTSISPPFGSEVNSVINGPIVLIGLMGSGKTTVGSMLSRQIKFAFVDIDNEITKVSGSSVSELFVQEGEEAFRARESAMLKHWLHSSPQDIVISTGGGVIMLESNRQLITQLANHVVWLDASVDALVERTSLGLNKRPLLEANPHTTLLELRAKRSDLYAQIADTRIDTTGLQLTQVVDVVSEVIRRKVPK